MMSPWDVMAWARATRSGSPGRKATLMALAEHAGVNEDGEVTCWPSQATLAEATEQSVRTIRDQLRDLEAAGFIRREGRHLPGRGRTSDRIHLLCRPADIAGRVEDPIGPPTYTDRSPGVHPIGPPTYTDRSPGVHPIGPPTYTYDAGGPTNTNEHQMEHQMEHQKNTPMPLKLVPDDPDAPTFDEWYSRYPRKKQPLDARKAWEKLTAGASGRDNARRILAHTLGPFADEMRDRALDKVPYPSTYLRKGEWLSVSDDEAKADARRRRALQLARRNDTPGGAA